MSCENNRNQITPNMSTKILTESILSKMPDVGKCQRKFFTSLVFLWLRLRGRYNFDNLARQSLLGSATYRDNFGKSFDFQTFNELLYEYVGQERLMVFDPCFISKSGKHTEGLGHFWSGCASQMKRGLEIGGLALVEVTNHTAFHYYAQQTMPKEGQHLLDYYTEFIVEQSEKIQKQSRYLAVDAYFSKYTFVEQVCATGLEVITRLRDDAVLRYRYLGCKLKKKGRPQQYGAKLDPKKPDLDYFRMCVKEDKWVAYEAILHAKALKRWVKVVLVHYFDDKKDVKSCKIFISTDTTMAGMDLLLYYQLRFQIEFLYRDGKQFLGLNHCQSRKKERLNFHFNFVLTLQSIIKVAHWLPEVKAKGDKIPFSVQNIKNRAQNEFLLERFIDVFGVCPQTPKYNQKLNELMDFAKIAT